MSQRPKNPHPDAYCKQCGKLKPMLKMEACDFECGMKLKLDEKALGVIQDVEDVIHDRKANALRMQRYYRGREGWF